MKKMGFENGFRRNQDFGSTGFDLLPKVLPTIFPLETFRGTRNTMVVIPSEPFRTNSWGYVILSDNVRGNFRPRKTGERHRGSRTRENNGVWEKTTV